MPSTHNIRVSDAVYQSLKTEARIQGRTMSAVLDRLLPPWKSMTAAIRAAAPDGPTAAMAAALRAAADHADKSDLTSEDEK